MKEEVQHQRGRVFIPAETFVRAWEAASSKTEVEQRLGMSKAAVNARANTYRRKGIQLKQLPRRIRKGGTDWAKLRELVIAHQVAIAAKTEE